MEDPRSSSSTTAGVVRSVLLGQGRVRDLDGNRAADGLAASREALVAAEVAQVELVAHWADLHNGDVLDGVRVVDGDAVVPPGMERAVRVGGLGTPRVREFAAAELGVLVGTTTNAARSLMGDVLNLRHRHPRLWAAVLAGRARFWQARQVTRIVDAAGLDRDGARLVDARTGPQLGTVPWGRMLALVEAAVIEADPEKAEERRLEKAMARFVRSGQSSEDGSKTLYARVEAGHAITFLAICDRIAQILGEQGDPDPVDVRRSKAIGWLGTPLRAAALLKQAKEAADTAADTTTADTTTAADDAAKQTREAAAQAAAREAGTDPTAPVEPEAPETPETPETPGGDGWITERDLHPRDNDADDADSPPGPAGRAPVLVIDSSVDLDRFLPAATLYVHMSLEQFLRETRGAARVEGLGPVTLEHAVDLLGHTRVRLKPVIDLHESWAVDGYQSPPRMREHVTLRYPVEVFPHGTAPSRGADKDHVTAYRHGRPAQTSTDNLAPLGRHHHRVKTHGSGWVHRQPVPGVHYWRTPHGHWSRVDHHGTHPLGRDPTDADQTLLDPDASRAEHHFAALIITT